MGTIGLQPFQRRSLTAALYSLRSRSLSESLPMVTYASSSHPPKCTARSAHYVRSACLRLPLINGFGCRVYLWLLWGVRNSLRQNSRKSNQARRPTLLQWPLQTWDLLIAERLWHFCLTRTNAQLHVDWPCFHTSDASASDRRCITSIHVFRRFTIVATSFLVTDSPVPFPVVEGSYLGYQGIVMTTTLDSILV